VIGEYTEIPEFANERAADLFLINDGGLGYTKIRFDARSVQTLMLNLGKINDPIARTLAWVGIWDMWRDAEIATHDFARLLIEGLKTEPLISLMTGLGNDLVSALEIHTAPERRDALRNEIASELANLLKNSTPGSDIQLQLAKVFAAIASTQEQNDFTRAMLDGELAGLIVDRDLRWYFIKALAERGEISRSEIDEALVADNTVNGQLSRAEAIASLPDASGKMETWNRLTNEEVSTSQRSHLSGGFMRPRQGELLTPYVDLYFAGVLEMWNSTSYEEASASVELLYPRYVISQSTLDKTDAWLNGVGANAPEALRRFVLEGRDALSRSLRIQVRDK
jgi:aminopeptidase N